MLNLRTFIDGSSQFAIRNDVLKMCHGHRGRRNAWDFLMAHRNPHRNEVYKTTSERWIFPTSPRPGKTQA